MDQTFSLKCEYDIYNQNKELKTKQYHYRTW
jgi:hypothetical protein